MDAHIINEAIKIVHEGWTDGIVLSYGSCSDNDYFAYGYISGALNAPASENTLYDIASVTKLFTLVAVLRLCDKGILSLEAQVGDYSTNFSNIGHIHIYELMNFSKTLITDRRIDVLTNQEEALSLLYNIKQADTPPRYSDMGPIILGLLIDSIEGMSFKETVKEIFNICQLNNTFWWPDLPNSITDSIQSYDNEYSLTNEGIKIINHITGIPHDKKAALLGTTAHAGIFSTPQDLSRFSISLLSNRLLSDESLECIGSKKYDYITNNGQRFGLLCYKKTENEIISEVPFQFSDNAIAISGYTGNYLMIDPNKNRFISINSNRIYNRCPSSYYDISGSTKGTRNYVYRIDKLLTLI